MKKASVSTLLSSDAVQHQPVYPLALIKLPVVIQRTALSKTTIYGLIKSNEFVKPINLGGKSIAFVESEVNDWIQARIDASRKGAI